MDDDNNGTPAEEEPLLVADQAAVWDDIEVAANGAESTTVQQLISQDPENVISYISRRGVVKLGEFKVQDTLMLNALAGEAFLTMGASARDIDYERAWMARLRKAAAHRKDADAGWSRQVQVEAFAVNIRDAAAPDVQGLVNPLLHRYLAGGCSYSVFALPAVQAVLQFKWDTFAGKWVRFEFGTFLTWLAAFSVFMLVFQDEDLNASLPELLATGSGAVTVAAEVIALVAMTPFVIIELGSLSAYARGWISMWNALDVITYALQVGIAVLHLGRLYLSSGWLSVLVAFQCVLLWFRLNAFSRIFGGSSSFSIIEAMQQVVVDIRMYLLYLLLAMWGFACAFCVLFRRDQEHEQFSNIGHALLTMFSYALGGVDLDTMLGSSNPQSTIILSLLYQFALSTVLMSLLTGVCAQAMSKATSHEDLKRLLSKAQAIDELESTMPAFIERLMPANYPAYVHVLRIDPQALDDANGSSAGADWRSHQRDAPQARGMDKDGTTTISKGSDTASMEVLMMEMQAMKAQISSLTQLLHTAMPGTPACTSESRHA